jgi:hypothetical protein
MANSKSVSKPDLSAIRAAIETNLLGLIQTTTAFLPLLRRTASPAAPAVILNVTTGMASNAFMASPRGILHHCLPYNTSKAAVNSYTIALAHELRDAHVKVNCATPAFTTTQLNGYSPGGKTPEESAEMLVEWCLMDKDGKTGGYSVTQSRLFTDVMFFFQAGLGVRKGSFRGESEMRASVQNTQPPDKVSYLVMNNLIYFPSSGSKSRPVDTSFHFSSSSSTRSHFSFTPDTPTSPRIR